MNLITRPPPPGASSLLQRARCCSNFLSDLGSQRARSRSKANTMEIATADSPNGIDFNEVQRFFEFFERNGVEFFILEALPRKINGERGAPIAKHCGISKPIGGASGMVKYIGLLRARLEAGGRIADLHVRESPGGKIYHRVLLVDDLEHRFLKKLAQDYAGPMIGIETSLNNYQALLIAPRFPRGLFAKEVRSVQQALALRYGGDLGAVGVHQLHRFAGSPNYKDHHRGAPAFFTRIELIQEARCGNEEAAADFLIGAMHCGALNQPVGKPTTLKEQSKRTVGNALRDETQSGEAFRYARKLLRQGKPREVILQELSIRWGAGRSPDWSIRTCWNAEFALGLRATRYSTR